MHYKESVFYLIQKYHDCIDWKGINRYDPTAKGISEAALYMQKHSKNHVKMRHTLLKEFSLIKQVRYGWQLKLLALLFEDPTATLSMLAQSIHIRHGLNVQVDDTGAIVSIA